VPLHRLCNNDHEVHARGLGRVSIDVTPSSIDRMRIPFVFGTAPDVHDMPDGHVIGVTHMPWMHG